MEKFRNKYRNDSTRLNNRDYGAPGYYFVTLCTQNRKDYFGHIEWRSEDPHDFGTPVGTQDLAAVILTPIGKIAHQYWLDIPDYFPFVVLDEFIVMPNHVHGILSFNKPGYSGGAPNTFGPQSRNLASVIRGYKAGIKKYATLNSLEFAWQPGYHDRIVRLDEFQSIRKYIRNNPLKWINDNQGTQNLASQHHINDNVGTQNLASQQVK